MGGLPVAAAGIGRDSDGDTTGALAATGVLADTVFCTLLSWINDFGVSDWTWAEYSQQVSYR
jgi:hypothetical protein